MKKMTDSSIVVSRLQTYFSRDVNVMHGLVMLKIIEILKIISKEIMFLVELRDKPSWCV